VRISIADILLQLLLDSFKNWQLWKR